MTAFNALVDDGYVTAPNPGAPPTDSNSGATRAASMGPNLSGASVAAVQGTSPLFGAHNTPLHVAFLGLIALAVVILLRKAGFRFSAVGKIAVGRG